CFFSSSSRHTRFSRDWRSDVCSSDLDGVVDALAAGVEAGVLALAVVGGLAVADDPLHEAVVGGAGEGIDVVPGGEHLQLAAVIRSEARRVGYVSCRWLRIALVISH